MAKFRKLKNGKCELIIDGVRKEFKSGDTLICPVSTIPKAFRDQWEMLSENGEVLTQDEINDDEEFVENTPKVHLVKKHKGKGNWIVYRSDDENEIPIHDGYLKRDDADSLIDKGITPNIDDEE